MILSLKHRYSGAHACNSKFLSYGVSNLTAINAKSSRILGLELRDDNLVLRLLLYRRLVD